MYLQEWLKKKKSLFWQKQNIFQLAIIDDDDDGDDDYDDNAFVQDHLADQHNAITFPHLKKSKSLKKRQCIVFF